ncbi:ATP-dependent RNA helicase DDX51 [Amphibalanus amphitrite]|uniref:ATP-dependent RNA helicase DDX51 n=1 Tax=Amphibalanus amphitrite TaxID=1232801 RepID=A0A6A4VN94_AMPAM|nr:ATP-dependent RNA helicase DDX51 [Amphibalanus amphitrite]
MAHSKDTQLGVYDVHGGVAVSARLRGHDAIIRERERLFTAEDSTLFDYGATVVGTHAAPTVRERLEAEQNKCARLITGCIRLTRKDALLAEADLPPLSLRAKQLAGLECQRLARLPVLDPARTLLEKEVRPRLEYRAHLAWRRDCAQAEAARRPPPKPPDEDAVLTKKPCLRRVGRWIADEAGLKQLPIEPLALYQCHPPWTVEKTPLTSDPSWSLETWAVSGGTWAEMSWSLQTRVNAWTRSAAAMGHTPTAVVSWLGGNDAYPRNPPVWEGLSQNLDGRIERMMASLRTQYEVYIVGPTPRLRVDGQNVWEDTQAWKLERHFAEMLREQGDVSSGRKLGKLVAVGRRLCTRQRGAVMYQGKPRDVYRVDKGMFRTDGVHLTEDGYRRPIGDRRPAPANLPALCPELRARLATEGIEQVFLVQVTVLPELLAAAESPLPPADLCVSAPAGRGKTLPFVLPLVQARRRGAPAAGCAR